MMSSGTAESGRVTANSRQLSRVMAAAETLFPGYFALVMATAAVSNASFLLGHLIIARALVGLNWVFYGSLWTLTIVCLVAFPRRLLANFWRTP